MGIKLTDDEYKKIVIEVAIKISSDMMKIKDNSELTGQAVALYARDIAEAVESILEDRSGNSL